MMDQRTKEFPPSPPQYHEAHLYEQKPEGRPTHELIRNPVVVVKVDDEGVQRDESEEEHQ